jgi:pimeloyl-ACP methyl ester carboxylesterase
MELRTKKEHGFEYVEEGDGPVLLLLHGLFGALSNWQAVLQFFSSRYKVVIPLMPIYEMPLKNTNVGGLTDFIHNFINYKGYDQITLLGNSLGGHVGLTYTIEHPEKVSALVLTGSSGLYENSMGGSFPQRNNYDFIRSKVEYTFYDPRTATKDLVDEVYETVNNRSRGMRIIAMAKSSIRHNLKTEIQGIQAPVCLIWGANDNITPAYVAEEFHKLIPKSELHFIDQCGHAAMMEKPEEFNQVLQHFLENVIPQPNPQNA